MDTLIKEIDIYITEEADIQKAVTTFLCAIKVDLNCTIEYNGEVNLLTVRIYAKPKE